MKFPFTIDSKRVALAAAGSGEVYVWDREWHPPEPPDLQTPVWCGRCFLRDFEKRHGQIKITRDQVFRSDVT